MMINNQQFCTFHLEGLFFGIEVHKVQEVLRYQEMTRVPIASPAIRGLINLRGQLVTAIDLRRRLGLEDRIDQELPMNVIVNTNDGAVSFLVDEIGDVIQVNGDIFERPPMT
ncbi:MAG: chemotaxis protein CheW, partial [Myxococcota bacterium]